MRSRRPFHTAHPSCSRDSPLPCNVRPGRQGNQGSLQDQRRKQGCGNPCPDQGNRQREEGETLHFVTTNDIYIFDKDIIPQGTKLSGYIEKKNEPVRGTNAAMKVFINKMYLPDGYEIPIKAYIYTDNDNKIGGELTAPENYVKIPHYQRWTMFRAQGVLQYVPGGQRKMGQHVTVSSGANLTMVIIEPIYMSHTVIN